MRNLLGFFFSLFFFFFFLIVLLHNSSYLVVFFLFFFNVFYLLFLYSVAATQPAPHVPLALSHIPFVLPSCCGQLVTLRITAKKKKIRSVICNTHIHTLIREHVALAFDSITPKNRKERKKKVEFIKYFTFFFLLASCGSFSFFFSQEEVHH